MLRNLKISLSPGEMKAVLSAVQFAFVNYPITDEFDMLLVLHLEEMRNDLAKRIINKKEKSIQFSNKQAVEFWYTWGQIQLTVFGAYEQQVMQKLFHQIDQYVKSIIPQVKHEQNEHKNYTGTAETHPATGTAQGTEQPAEETENLHEGAAPGQKQQGTDSGHQSINQS